MSELVLQVGDDHVARIAHEGDPARAVIELVWNAVDAEADTVTITFERAVSEAITAVRVTDNGHGICPDEVQATFGRVGCSWKKFATKTKNDKRTLHGERGEGRLRAFALGSHVAWESVGTDTSGVRFKTTITSDRTHRHIFQAHSVAAAETDNGTTVTASNYEDRNLNVLDSAAALAVVLAQFAPVILNEPTLAIVYDKTRLDPVQHVAEETVADVPFAGQTASLRIIEWKDGTERRMYVGSDGTHFPYDEQGNGIESQFPFSAYVTWPAMTDEQHAVLGLHDLASEPVGDMWKAVRKHVREHFNGRRRDRRRDQIVRWKSQGAYPYTGEPTTPADEAERAIFDVVSGTLVPHIATSKDPARLTLALLKDALQNDPDRLTTIIHEVVSLNEHDRDTLTRLLGETTLSAIIRSTSLVSARRKFLASLDHMLFDPDDSLKVGERDHLHKMLLHELWVFGEGYAVMNSEKGLTNLARTHLGLVDLPDEKLETVRRWDGRTGRVDLHFAVRDLQHDRARHLVVELKAPGITIGRKELDQVEDYANTVVSAPVFSTGNSEWDFILLVTDYDDVVDNRLHAGRTDGLFWAPDTRPRKPKVRAFVRKWRHMIDENAQRLDFLTHALNLDPSLAEGMDYVRQEYRDLLPNTIRDAK